MRRIRCAFRAAALLTAVLFVAAPTQSIAADDGGVRPLFQASGADASRALGGEPTQPNVTAAEDFGNEDLAGEVTDGNEPTVDDWQQLDAAALAAWQAAARDELLASWTPVGDRGRAPARIAAFAPQPQTLPVGTWAPPWMQIEALSHWARIREDVADFSGAHDTYARAIGLGGDTLANWRGLARTCVRRGEPEAAEAAFLAALGHASSTALQSHLTQADILRELGELYLSMGWPKAAEQVLEEALELAPGSRRAQRLWTTAMSAMTRADPSTHGTGTMELWPPTRAERWRAYMKSSLEPVLSLLPADQRHALEDSALAQAITLLCLLLLALGLLAFVFRALRRSGDLVVSINYPDELQGLFSVRLATSKGRFRRPGQAELINGSRSKSTRWSHYSVSRETQFLRLPTHRYYVTLHGLLTDPQSGTTLSEAFEEHSVDLAGGETNRVCFDLVPRECPVDVTVNWGNRRAGDIGVAARGYPQALRYATNAAVRLRLPMGSHTIVVGSGDRIAECDVEVQSYHATSVEIDLGSGDQLVFKGCPPAVEPYLHGDLNGAARALERDGHQNVAHLLLARLHQEQGQTERAAERLESAGHNLEAAKLRESISDFARAAELFEGTGNVARAAETYRRAGEWKKAGELYQSLDDYARAGDCFREAGASEALAGVLELQGRCFEAACVSRESGDRASAIRLLQQVRRADPSYPEACMQLVDAFEQEGHADLAANKLEEYLLTAGVTGNAAQYDQLAELLNRGGEPARALEVLEALRDREPTYANIASRIEALRKLVSGRSLEDNGSTAPTRFVAEQRYEIIEEIGRGGMGLIFKARDRRLNRIVALKRLPENLREHPKALSLFLNEAQAAARLNHANIVTVFDTDQEDGTFFITMELLEGIALNALLRERGRLGPRDTAKIGAQVSRGLQYAHDQQVVHRDIKTANLFLTRDRTIKIMDFGLAKMMEEVRRGSTVIGGTPSYMAPEQATGDAVDHRADIYAFGVTLFELLTGRVPFVEGDVAYHHRHTQPPDPRSIVSGIPDDLAELVLDMIAKDPARRTASALDVERRLEQTLSD